MSHPTLSARSSKRIALLIVVFVCALLLFQTRAWGVAFYAEKRITTHSSVQRVIELSGTRMLYEDYRNQSEVGEEDDPTTLFDIRVRDLATGSDRLVTPEHTAYGSAAISGDYIVWEDWGTSSRTGGIYYYNYKTRARKRLPVSGRELAISGDRVAYESYRSGWKVYVYDISSKTEKKVTSSASVSAGAPDISGKRVVWQDFRDGNHDIYLYDLGTKKEKQITTNAEDQVLPKISGDRIVWTDDRNGLLNDDVYLYDLSTGTERRITTDPGRQSYPVISGKRVVWQDERHGGSDVYLYDLRTGTEARVTSSPEYNSSPIIADDRILYDSVRGGNHDIYGRQINLPKVTFSSAPKMSKYTVKAGRSYSVWGYIQPKHTKGSHQIKVKAYKKVRKSNGTYAYVWKKTFSTTISNPSGSAYSKYKGKVKLPSKGKWRLRAYHAKDTVNAKSYSTYRYVTVK